MLRHLGVNSGTFCLAKVYQGYYIVSS